MRMHTGSRVAGGLLALTTLLWAGASAAQDNEVEDRRFYIAPMASYSFFDEDSFEPDDEVGAQLSVGKRLTDYLAMELYATYFNDVALERGLGSDANLDTAGYGVGALIFPMPDIAPIFGIVGGGLGQYDFDQRSSGPRGLNSQESEFVDVGLGFLWPITDHGTALRGEYRYRSSEVDAPGGSNYQFRNDVVSLGIQIPLGAKPQPSQPTTEPAPEPVKPNDGDGDGVIDRWDQCPDTPTNTAVDSNGCAVEQETTPIVLKGVTFEFDSAKLTSEAEDQLDTVVESLKMADQIDVKVGGHTDSIGSESYNQKLSQERADAVKAYLVNHGIAPERLTTKGYGESKPIAPNTDPDGSDNPTGRAMNRRVELHVTDE